MRMKCDYCNKVVKGFNIHYLTRALRRHERKCKEKKNFINKNHDKIKTNTLHAKHDTHDTTHN